MTEQPILTDAEWNVIVELLRLELQELPTEIHHASQVSAAPSWTVSRG